MTYQRASWTLRPLRRTVLSVLLEAASHLVWDGFTHAGRFGSRWFPTLHDGWGPLVGTKWLQYGSSAVGLAVLAGFAIMVLARSDRHSSASALNRSSRCVGRTALIGFPVVAGVVRVVSSGGLDAGSAVAAVTTAISTAVAVAAVAGFVMLLGRRDPAPLSSAG